MPIAESYFFAGLRHEVEKNIEGLNIKNIGHSLGEVGVYNGKQ